MKIWEIIDNNIASNIFIIVATIILVIVLCKYDFNIKTDNEEYDEYYIQSEQDNNVNEWSEDLNIIYESDFSFIRKRSDKDKIIYELYFNGDKKELKNEINNLNNLLKNNKKIIYLIIDKNNSELVTNCYEFL